MFELEPGRKARAYESHTAHTFPAKLSGTNPPLDNEQPYRADKSEGSVVFAIGEVLVEGEGEAGAQSGTGKKPGNLCFVQTEFVGK